MESIRIENVKTLGDTGVIPIKPITLLVGKNSSGKSTFLRTFPLIKQSIRKSTDGPLLWAGDVDDYIDFGSFSETITSRGVQDQFIRFQFDFNLKLCRSYYHIEALKESSKNIENNRTSYSISIKQVGSKEYVSRLAVHFCQSQFVFEMNPNPNDITVVVDGICVSLQKKSSKNKIITPLDHELKSIFGFELPTVAAFLNDTSKSLFPENDELNVKLALESFDQDVFLAFTYREMAMQVVGECLCRNVPLSVLSDVSSMGKNRPEINHYILRIIKQIDQIYDITQRKQYTSILKLIYFYSCFPTIDRYINTYFRRVHYIAPLRATAERYYRLRNVSIDEVDYQGKNLAIFLEGLKRNNQLNEFNQWTDDLFGFHVHTQSDSGHITIQISMRGKNNSTNLSDVGFGFSQLLPIITQLWKISTNKKAVSYQMIPFVLAIEQPELHLHPALQSNLAEAFIKAIEVARKNKYSLQLILETHSETIVNYFGRAVAENKLDRKDISVVLFNKDIDDLTKIQISDFDNDGYLCNWPIGFFS